MENFYSNLTLELLHKHMPFMIERIEMPKKHCTAILVDGELATIGFNRYKTSQISIEFGYQFGEYHSELDALIQMHSRICGISRDRLTMVNFRINRFKQVGISRPCPKCLSWVHNIFGTIVYTNTFGGITKESLITGEHCDIISGESFQEKFLPKYRSQYAAA
jgi:alpha-tubulin suppressor-like RCC1 family protein